MVGIVHYRLWCRYEDLSFHTPIKVSSGKPSWQLLGADLIKSTCKYSCNGIVQTILYMEAYWEPCRWMGEGVSQSVVCTTCEVAQSVIGSQLSIWSSCMARVCKNDTSIRALAAAATAWHTLCSAGPIIFTWLCSWVHGHMMVLQRRGM